MQTLKGARLPATIQEMCGAAKQGTPTCPYDEYLKSMKESLQAHNKIWYT
jgi:hypothetical protein